MIHSQDWFKMILLWCFSVIEVWKLQSTFILNKQFPSLFFERKKVIQISNDMRMSKWQKFHFILSELFLYGIFQFVTVGICIVIFVLWPLYHPAHMVSRGLASAQCINRHTGSCKRIWIVCVNSCLGKMLSVGPGVLLFALNSKRERGNGQRTEILEKHAPKTLLFPSAFRMFIIQPQVWKTCTPAGTGLDSYWLWVIMTHAADSALWNTKNQRGKEPQMFLWSMPQ